MSEPVFSVIAPIYNELENLPLLYERVKAVMDSTGEPWELILVDDGSSDGSTDVMRKLAAEDERIRPVIFARNFGHQIAVTAGMDYAQGDAVVLIDADLQDPPELIPEMVQKWQEGAKVVHAVRRSRETDSWLSELVSNTVPAKVRLARLLLQLRIGDSDRVHRLSLADFGGILGITPETVSRLLSELGDSEILIKAGRGEHGRNYRADIPALTAISQDVGRARQTPKTY